MLKYTSVSIYERTVVRECIDSYIILRIFLANRSKQVAVEHVQVNSGVQQGSVLGPILFYKPLDKFRAITPLFILYGDNLKFYTSLKNQDLHSLHASLNLILWRLFTLLQLTRYAIL